MFKQKGFTGKELFIVGWILFLVLAFGGWVANIVKIINTGFDVFTGLLIARCIGVFFAPLGAVLGYV